MIRKLFSTRTSFHNRGFTLIELLVVISIIGMLSSVVFATVQTANVKAHNTKNTGLIQSYIFALQSYRNEFGYFPIGPNNPYIECFSDRDSDRCGFGNFIENSDLYTALEKYIPPKTAMERVDSASLGNNGYYDGPVYYCTQPTIVSGVATSCKKADIEWVQKYVSGTTECAPGVVIIQTGNVVLCRVTVN